MDQEEGLVEHKFLPWSSSCYNVCSNLILNFQTNENNFISTCHHSINLECSFLWSFVNLKRKYFSSIKYFVVRRIFLSLEETRDVWHCLVRELEPLSPASSSSLLSLRWWDENYLIENYYFYMIREVRSCFTEQSWAVAPVWLTLPLLLILWMWWNKLLTTLTVLSIIICQTVSVRRISSTWWMCLSGVRCTVLP